MVAIALIAPCPSLLQAAFKSGELSDGDCNPASMWYGGIHVLQTPPQPLLEDRETLKFVSKSPRHELCQLTVLLPCGSLQPIIKAWGTAVAEPTWLRAAARGPVNGPEDLAALLSDLGMCSPCSCLHASSVHGDRLAEMTQLGRLPGGTMHVTGHADVNLWRAAGCQGLISGMSLFGARCGACRQLAASSNNHGYRQLNKRAPAPGDDPVGMTTSDMVKLCQVSDVSSILFMDV